MTLRSGAGFRVSYAIEGGSLPTGRIAMKFSLQGLVLGSLGAVALSLAPLAVKSAGATPPQEITLDAHRVQIVHTNGYNTDYTNFNITFTNHGEYPFFNCDGGGDDAFSGIEVAL